MTFKNSKITVLFSTEKEENKELPVVKPKYEEHVVEDFQEAMQGNADLILQYIITK